MIVVTCHRRGHSCYFLGVCTVKNCKIFFKIQNFAETGCCPHVRHFSKLNFMASYANSPPPQRKTASGGFIRQWIYRYNPMTLPPPRLVCWHRRRPAHIWRGWGPCRHRPTPAGCELCTPPPPVLPPHIDSTCRDEGEREREMQGCRQLR